MSYIDFSDVTFIYPALEGDLDENGEQIKMTPVFSHFTGGIPKGFTSLIGPNGSGKSTFLMLASGRLIPQEGKCFLDGKDIASLNEEDRNLLASVIYQNMEFESTASVNDLLEEVYRGGSLKGSAKGILDEDADLKEELIGEFELRDVLSHPLNGISKGENQRVLLAFSILYGSKSIFMDEPMFAMEDAQKEKALSYLRSFYKKTNTPIYISMHELELTRRYAESVLLFYPDRTMDYGTPEEVMTPEALEKAYGVPLSMLKHSEDMTREELQQAARTIAALK